MGNPRLVMLDDEDEARLRTIAGDAEWEADRDFLLSLVARYQDGITEEPHLTREQIGA